MNTTLRSVFRIVLFGAGLTVFGAPASAFYDPFEDVTSIAPSDELETRMWDESRLLRNQLIRPEHQPTLQAATRLVQSVFARHFPALQDLVKVYVYKESELAVVGTPHGEIFLSSGLMLRMEHEEDLVVILARELAHVYQRDSARTLSYARTGSNLKEVFSTSFAAYNVAAGLINLNSLAGSLTSLSPDLLLQQLQLTPEKLMESGGSLFAKMLKEQLQDDLEGLGRNLGGVLVHRLSVQAVAALVKTSLYGYSDRIENQADQFALTFLQQRYGHVDHYERFFQRLLEQSKADGDVPFLSFYSNPKRLQSRLDSVKDWRESASPVPVAIQLSQKNETTILSLSDPPALLWREEENRSSLADSDVLSADVEVSAVIPPPGVAASSTPVGDDQTSHDTEVKVTTETASGDAALNPLLEEVVVSATAEPLPQQDLKTSLLLNGELKRFFLDALDQEARQGAPRRFLSNLGRLHAMGLIDPKDTRPFETKALRTTKKPQDTEKALGLLQMDLQQSPDNWGTHQLIADVYLELKAYDLAVTHYAQALELIGEDERRLFIHDRKTRAENLYARESKKK